ncbi:MAG: hypothetical protein ABI294_04720, partial [Casimicrobiaceae bacterium]
NFVTNRWMLPEDANTALHRMLTAGYSTGAIKIDSKSAPLVESLISSGAIDLEEAAANNK